jgi:hypothetical protein
MASLIRSPSLSQFIIPWFDGNQKTVLTIRMSAGRPKDEMQAEADIYLDDYLLKPITTEMIINSFKKTNILK